MLLRAVLVGTVCLEVGCLIWLAYSQNERIAPPLVRAETRADDIAAKVRVLPGEIAANDVEAWVSKAEWLRRYGFFPESDYCFSIADAHQGLSGDGLHQWATCLEQMGALDRAHSVFHLALQRGTTDDATTWGALALLNLRRVQLQEAEAAFEKAGPLPHLVPHHIRLLIRTDRLDEAKALITQVEAKLNPYAAFRIAKLRLAEAVGNRPMAGIAEEEFAQRGDLDLPISDRCKDKEQRIDFVMGDSLYASQARALYEHGDYQAALNKMREVTQFSHWEQDTILLCDLEIQAGDPSVVPPLIESSLQNSGSSPQLMRVLGDAYGQLGKTDLASQAWQRGLELYPTADLHFRLAKLYELGKQIELRDFHYANGLVLEGRSNYLADDCNAARDKFAEATQRDGNNTQAWYYLGLAQRLLGQPNEARDSIQNCLKLNPNHGRALALNQLLAHDRVPAESQEQ